MEHTTKTREQIIKEREGLANISTGESIEWTKSTCPYCGIGCGLIVGVSNGRIVETHGMKGHPVNDGKFCHLGKTLPDVFAASGRLTQHMIRRNDKLVPVNYNDAITHVANEFTRIIDKYGPNAVAFFGGAHCLTEEYYLINKLFKGFISSNNIECSTRLCMASTAMGFASTIGIDAPPACYADIEEADLFFIAGNNMAVSLPILFDRVVAAKKRNGAKVIVVDPRKSEITEIADIHLQIWPGTDVALNNALAYVLLNDGLVDEANVERHASGLSDLKEFLIEYTPAKVAKITGCTEDQIIKTAHTIAEAKAMLTFWFQGYNHSTQAVFKNNTLHNLSLLTDNFCRVGAGPLSLTGEANALGNRWVGALSHLLPGVRQVANYQHRTEVADYWGVPVVQIQPVPGRSIIDIIKGLHSGEVRALWVMGTNPAASLPSAKWVEDAFAKSELLVVQDIFHPTETTMLADVVLAAAQWCEKTGTLISSERRIELAEKVIEPPGDARPDHEIISSVARSMGFDKEFAHRSSEEVFEEWKGITRGRICDMNGVTYERLRGKVGPQLPCPDIGHPGTSRLYIDHQFPRPDGRAALLARKYIEPDDTTNEKYPLVLITGRLPWHFNTRTRTGRVPILNAMEPDNFVEVNPRDAACLDLNENDNVEIKSRRDSVLAKVRIKDRILKGTIYMNMHYGKSLGIGDRKSVNLVTNPAYDINSKQPELKYCAVNILKISI